MNPHCTYAQRISAARVQTYRGEMTNEQHLGTFSSARIANGIVFTSGKVGLTQAGERPERFEDEVKAAIADLESTMIECGSGLDLLNQVHCILSDMANFDEFDRIYKELIPAPAPPRFTHGGALVQNFRFEIVGIASVRTTE